VRCSTDPSCTDTASVTVPVACPGDLSPLACGKAPPLCTYDPGENDSVETDFAKGQFSSGACTPLHGGGCTSLSYAGWVASSLVPAGTAYDHSADTPAVGRLFGYVIKLDGPPSAEHCNSPDWGNESPSCLGCPARNVALGDP
jgi:hypothetical protein